MSHLPFTPTEVLQHPSPSRPRLRDGRITVLVADPHCVVREGIRALLSAQPDMCVVGEACDGPTSLALARELDPAVVVLEVYLPGLDGAQVTARLREACPDWMVLVLTACEGLGPARLLLGMGAQGYALKRSPSEELLKAVRVVAAGGTYLDPGIADELVGHAECGKPSEADLSVREVQVMRLIALGYSNKEIAMRLHISIKTVETYKTRSMEKLHIRSRVDIVRYAVQCGWLSPEVSGLPD